MIPVVLTAIGAYLIGSSKKDKQIFADGGVVKVGTFNEAQLRKGEDKVATEKAMKESGLKYVDTKIVKKGGKMYMDVYLITDEAYHKSSKFAKGGEVNKFNVGDKVKVLKGANKGLYGIVSNTESDFFGDYTIDVRGHKLYGFKAEDLEVFAKGGKVRKGNYTYIPNEEIESLTTWNGVEFKGDELLDGSYAKGRRKYGDGGVMEEKIETITQAEFLNQNFKEAKEAIIEIHKRIKLAKGKEYLLLKKESGWGLSKYNPKTKKELVWNRFNDKEEANYWFDKIDINKYDKGGDIETGAANSVKDFVVSYNEHARKNYESTINKGYLMKVAFGENYTNVDSALPMGLLEEMGIGNSENWHYVMDYNNKGAFGNLTDLFEVIAEKNPTIEIFNEEYEKTDTLPILEAVEKYKNQDVLWQFKRTASQFAVGGAIPNNYRGVSDRDLWESWTDSQKLHFLEDHKDKYTESYDYKNADLVDTAWDELPSLIKRIVNEHRLDGQYAKGGEVGNLEKELHRLQRELNSSRLSTYIEGDESDEEKACQKEREVKLARFNEVLKLLKEKDDKFAKGGKVRKGNYTYIPNEEIESMTTWNGVEFKGDELLDGSYARGRRKYGEGGTISPKVNRLLDSGFEFVTWTDYGNYVIILKKKNGKIEYTVFKGFHDRKKIKTFDSKKEAFAFLSLKAGRKVSVEKMED
jgi:hypothetical protein